MADKPYPDFKELTDREVDCMEAMLTHWGQTAAAIALNLSKKTVQTHLDRIRLKAYFADTDITTLRLCVEYDRWKREQRSVRVMPMSFIP